MIRASETQTKTVIERTYRASLQDVWELWTTREGFESWWGPQGFYVTVAELDARVGGALRYEMIAGSEEVIRAMAAAGQPPSHAVRSTFADVRPMTHLVLRNVMDFIPGVAPYEADITVDLSEEGDRVRMVVTLSPLHDPEFGKMQIEGFTSQLTKLDGRFG